MPYHRGSAASPVKCRRLIAMKRCHASSDTNANNERSSSGDFAGLEDVDGFGDLSGAPGATAEFAQDSLGLELRVGTLAGGAQLRVGGVGGFLRGGLVLAPVGGDHRFTSTDVVPVGQHD